MSFKVKECKECKNEFIPLARCNLYCSPECLKESVRRSSRERNRIHRLKLEKQVGVGSGNAQGSGEAHHSYKSGIKGFSKRKLDSMDVHVCEECGEDLTALVKTSRFMWAVHHVDHDRSNNKLENLRLLCKRCHQVVHKCHENFHKV